MLLMRFHTLVPLMNSKRYATLASIAKVVNRSVEYVRLTILKHATALRRLSHYPFEQIVASGGSCV